MRTALALLASLGLAACTGRAPEDVVVQNSTTTTDGAAMARADGLAAPVASATPTTPDFVAKMAVSDLFEIESAKVILARSRNAEVKKFAQMMIADHSATTAAVKAIVVKDRLAAPPAALDAAHEKLLGDLKATGAAELETVYLDQQTKAHGDALALLTGYGQGGDNPDLKAFAGETAPKVQSHLDTAKSLDQGGADDQPAG